jgi:NAD(P)-dependent dehydrogenase (short-subunit alcohol dehydrogenase family)
MDFRNAFDFSGRRVVVVGASRGGIGASIADAFKQCGANVTITGIESEPIESDRGKYVYFQLDVAEPDAVQRFADEVGALDILVNCAGMGRRDQEYEPATFKRVMETNLYGLLYLSNSFKPALTKSKGSILAIASMYAAFGSPRIPAYGASKAGVSQMTKSLAIAFAAESVRVNAIAPGFIATEQTARVRADETHYRRVLERSPMNRWGEPGDIAGAALFLASPAAEFITGVTLPVDGGYSVT